METILIFLTIILGDTLWLKFVICNIFTNSTNRLIVEVISIPIVSIIVYKLMDKLLNTIKYYLTVDYDIRKALIMLDLSKEFLANKSKETKKYALLIEVIKTLPMDRVTYKTPELINYVDRIMQLTLKSEYKEADVYYNMAKDIMLDKYYNEISSNNTGKEWLESLDKN